MLRLHRFFLTTLVGTCAGCAAAGVSESTVTPSELNKSPQLYDGKKVIVEGYVDVAPERRFLQDGKPNDNPPPEGSCITMLSSDRLVTESGRFNEKRVRVKGTFVADYTKKGLFNLGSCSNRAVVLDAGDPTIVVP